MILTCGCEVSAVAPARIIHACEQHGRISLRDHFAAKALPAALTAFYDVKHGQPWDDHDDLAEHIYNVADAMLRAREAK